MNLLENYINKIYSEKDVTDVYIQKVGEQPAENVIEVDLEVNCYGNIKRETKVFLASMWKAAKTQGYYLE